MAEYPPIGSLWRERRPYQERVVTVLEHLPNGRVRIQSNVGTKTTARADRFGGGKSGYTRYEGDLASSFVAARKARVGGGAGT